MAKRKTLRVGVIGVGAIAQACHLPGYYKDKRARIAAIADPSRARHREAGLLCPDAEIEPYTDYREMLAVQELDVVSVCTPNAYHAEAALAALRAGCHVLCEKPMAVSLEEADAMADAARQARKKLMVAFSHRMMTGPQHCKRLLQEKAIGRPFMIRVRFAHGGPFPGWAKDPDTFYKKEHARGGALLDMGIHAIDLCQWLMGPMVSVSARVGNLAKRIEVEDNALLTLEFRNRAMGYIEAGWTSKPGFAGIEIYGTEGTIICDYLNGMRLGRGHASPSGESSFDWETVDSTPAQGGWEVEMGHWLDVVTGKERNTMDAKAGRSSLAVALAAYRSSTEGEDILVDG